MALDDKPKKEIHWRGRPPSDIQNIYNNETEEVPRYNERLDRAETDDAIGILPSIGLSLEF